MTTESTMLSVVITAKYLIELLPKTKTSRHKAPYSYFRS